MFEDFGINAGFVEDLHAQYRQSRQSVDEQWRAFFDAFERGETAEAPGTDHSRNGHDGDARDARIQPGGNGHTNGNGATQRRHRARALPGGQRCPAHGTNGARDERLLAAAVFRAASTSSSMLYGVRGHLFAKIDPLGTPPTAAPELSSRISA